MKVLSLTTPQALNLPLALIKLLFIFFAAGLAPAVFAQADEKPRAVADITPHQVVEQVTTELMKLVESKQNAIKQNPEKYYADVHAILDDAVNFQFIARAVMGSYWKQATPEQQKSFVETFKKDMVETYAKGMANFADLKIEVEPPQGEVPTSGKATVVQKITSADKVNRVAYTLGKREGGQWQLINVVLDGVNLGKTLRSQFAQAMKENNGDLDSTIANWASQSEPPAAQG